MSLKHFNSSWYSGIVFREHFPRRTVLVQIMLATLTDKSRHLSALTQEKLVPCADHSPGKVFQLGVFHQTLSSLGFFLPVAPSSSGPLKVAFIFQPADEDYGKNAFTSQPFQLRSDEYHFCSSSGSRPCLAAEKSGKSTHAPRREGNSHRGTFPAVECMALSNLLNRPRLSSPSESPVSGEHKAGSAEWLLWKSKEVRP